MIVLNVNIILYLEISDRDCKQLDNMKYIIIRASSIILYIIGTIKLAKMEEY